MPIRPERRKKQVGILREKKFLVTPEQYAKLSGTPKVALELMRNSEGLIPVKNRRKKYHRK